MNEKEVKDFILLLQTIVLSQSHTSYSDVKKELMRYSIPFPVVTIQKGTPLYRARGHFDGEDYFTLVSQLSLKDKHLIQNFGRANEPNQSVFYCSTESELTFMETSVNVRKDLSNQSEIFTTSEWEVLEDLCVILISSKRRESEINNTLENLGLTRKYIEEYFQRNDIHFLYHLVDFISDEFTKRTSHTNEYLLSCAFANYIYDIKARHSNKNLIVEIDGCMYPSVQYGVEGLNLALNSNVVQKGKLKFVRAMRSRMEKINNEFFKEMDIIVSRRIDNGLIIW